MNLKFWQKKPEPTPEPTAEDKLWDALEAFNQAWADYEQENVPWNDRLKPWLSWKDRELVLTTNHQNQAHRVHTN